MSSGKNATMLLGCNNNYIITDNDQLSEALLRVIIYYHYECDGCNCLNYKNKVRTWGFLIRGCLILLVSLN